MESHDGTPAQDALFMQVRHSRTADEVVQQIEMLILQGILRDGDRLPGERDLALRFDISRPILREALKELENRGLLVSHHGGGTFVADIVGQVFSKPLTDLIARHERATRDYLEYRRELEGLTAELAAQRATDADKTLLARIIENMKAAHEGGRFEDELATDVEFHSAIGEAAHNIILMHTMRACYRLLSEGIFYNRRLIFALPGAHDLVMAQHVAIHDAIVSGDPVAARAAAEAHIDFIVEATLEAEQTGERNRVARLRILQRDTATVPQRATKTTADGSPADG